MQVQLLWAKSRCNDEDFPAVVRKQVSCISWRVMCNVLNMFKEGVGMKHLL